MILNNFPSDVDFYKNYWCKKPFIVRNYIPIDAIDNLVDGDTLAGFSLEEEIKSRVIINNQKGNDWVCEHGPFDDDYFDNIGDQNWSLLVQNVEQYHADTAQLLTYFQFSPRWLLDDIMVSFSTPGGSVGPHIDSYHTFLVQGIGKREWKISENKINDDRYVNNPDMKILKHGFDGYTFEVTAGDIIYMPPFFGHEGKTLDLAMTFSIGFLGPKTSEMLSDYAHYLEERENLNKRFLGGDLDVNSASFIIGHSTQDNIRNDIISSIQSNDFTAWMAAYFSTPNHEEIENKEPKDSKKLLQELENGKILTRLEEIKIAITQSQDNSFNLAIYGETITISATQKHLIEKLNTAQEITISDLNNSDDKDEAIEIITALYQMNFFNFL